MKMSTNLQTIEQHDVDKFPSFFLILFVVFINFINEISNNCLVEKLSLFREIVYFLEICKMFLTEYKIPQFNDFRVYVLIIKNCELTILIFKKNVSLKSYLELLSEKHYVFTTKLYLR